MNEENKTPQEKQRETRRRNIEAKKQRVAEAAAERKLIRQSLKSVLESKEATAAEKLESSKLLLEMDKSSY